MKNYPARIIVALSFVWFFSCTVSTKPTDLLEPGREDTFWSLSGQAGIADGVMTLGEGFSGATLTAGDYTDFVFRTRVLTTGGAKGRIAFHCSPNGSPAGYSVSIDNDPENPQWWKKTGSLVSVRNLTKSLARDGEWFTLEVIVSGKYIRVDVNGQPVVEYIEPGEPYRTEENRGMLLSRGTFEILKQPGGEIFFKDMTVRVPSKKEKIFCDGPDIPESVDETTDEIIRLHQEDFPVLDYHVHLKGGLTKERAAVQSRRTGINYAIAPNCGIGFSITDDSQVRDFLDTMRMQPFILAMQAEGREWIGTFSESVRGQFDYVFTDALTFSDHKGRRTRLWIPEETWIEDQQLYMDLIVDKICMVLNEPLDIYVNPCFLPSPMDERYDELWTEQRIDRFVSALAASGKALEINELYQIPNKAILMKAKQAGVKFTFGSNNVVPEVSMLEYGIRMKKECGLTPEDMYRPNVKL